MEKKELKILEMISNDMKNDVKELDGKPFDGKTVAEQFGKQAAAIAEIANILIRTNKKEKEK